MDKLRTDLANERTLLAYIRTALALMIFGMAAIKFFYEEPVIVAFGWFFFIAGVLALAWSVWHYKKISTKIKADQKSGKSGNV